MGRFRSSFEDLKPYLYASEIVISHYTKLNIYCVKVKSLFSCITPTIVNSLHIGMVHGEKNLVQVHDPRS